MVTKSLQQFLAMDPKVFLKAPWAAIYTLLRGERAPKKRIFFKIFQKVPKTDFSACLFKIMPAAQKFWPKQGLFSALLELEK